MKTKQTIQNRILDLLKTDRGMHYMDIATALNVGPSTVAGYLTRLKHRGLAFNPCKTIVKRHVGYWVRAKKS